MGGTRVPPSLNSKPSGATLGTVLDGCDGGAVAAKYRSPEANLRIRTRSRNSPYLLDSLAAAA